MSDLFKQKKEKMTERSRKKSKKYIQNDKRKKEKCHVLVEDSKDEGKERQMKKDRNKKTKKGTKTHSRFKVLDPLFES